MSKPVVYIASPYTKGDVGINTRFQCQVFDELMDDGVVWPVVPLWSHFQHVMFPRKYQDWIDYDLALLPRYDACLRLIANFKGSGIDYSQMESTGADGEVKAFKDMGKPVFYNLIDLYPWARKFNKDKPSNPVLLGLCGFAGTGKDAICAELGFHRAAYADELKRELSDVVNPLMEDGGLSKDQVRPLWVAYGRACRQMDPGYWVDRIRIPTDRSVVVTDVRYLNEVNQIIAMGGKVVRVHRDGIGPANDEEAQTIAKIDAAMPCFPCVYNNGSIREAADTVRKILSLPV